MSEIKAEYKVDSNATPANPTSAGFDANLINLAKTIQGMIFDVDGVLTDGNITYGDDGTEYKSFNVQDGASIKALAAAGIQIAIITGRSSPIVQRRAQELGITCLKQGADNKAQALDDLIAQDNFPSANLAMVGDDLQDLTLYQHPAVTLGVSVANGHPEVKQRAKFVTQRAGGQGICVELAMLLLKAQGKWSV